MEEKIFNVLFQSYNGKQNSIVLFMDKLTWIFRFYEFEKNELCMLLFTVEHAH